MLLKINIQMHKFRKIFATCSTDLIRPKKNMQEIFVKEWPRLLKKMLKYILDRQILRIGGVNAKDEDRLRK